MSLLLILSGRYEKIRSSDVIQLELSDLGDVDVCREIDSGELKEKHTHSQINSNTHSHIQRHTQTHDTTRLLLRPYVHYVELYVNLLHRLQYVTMRRDSLFVWLEKGIKAVYSKHILTPEHFWPDKESLNIYLYKIYANNWIYTNTSSNNLLAGEVTQRSQYMNIIAVDAMATVQ